MEAYRSGHNGPDSKSGSPQGLVGSNPTASAKNRTTIFNRDSSPILTGRAFDCSAILKGNDETPFICGKDIYENDEK